MSEQMTQSSRLLVWMGAGLAVLVIVAAIVVAFRSPAHFEPGTPEAVVQEYIEAVLDEDAAAARELLTQAMQSRCQLSDLERRYIRAEQSRILLVDSSIEDNEARVELEFTAAYGDDPFDIYESSFKEKFKLRDVDGEWRIASAPWPYYRCAED